MTCTVYRARYLEIERAAFIDLQKSIDERRSRTAGNRDLRRPRIIASPKREVIAAFAVRRAPGESFVRFECDFRVRGPLATVEHHAADHDRVKIEDHLLIDTCSEIDALSEAPWPGFENDAQRFYR
jgi:hypothetical protein